MREHLRCAIWIERDTPSHRVVFGDRRLQRSVSRLLRRYAIIDSMASLDAIESPLAVQEYNHGAIDRAGFTGGVGAGA